MDDRTLAKLLAQAGQDPGSFVGTASQMNADGTVTITGVNGTVTAIAQTAFRSGNWSAKQVGSTWYAWSENSPVVESESKIQRKGRSETKKESESLTLLISVTRSGQEYFYAVSDTYPLKEIAVLPVSSALAPAHLVVTTVRGKRKYLFSCIYESEPTEATDNTGFDLFMEPVHYTIKTKGVQNWELNCYFDISPTSSPLRYSGAGFWYQSTIVDPTTNTGFISYAYSVKTPEGAVSLVRSTVYTSSLSYPISPNITKTVNVNEFAASNLISLDQKSIFYTKTTPTASTITRMRTAEELQVSKPSSMSLSSLYSCEYKNDIYNFNPQVGSFIFGSSVSLAAVKSYGIRVYTSTPGGATVSYQESTSRIPITSLKGIDGLSSAGQLKIHSAFYG